MNADGSGLIKLTDHPADDYLPLWSPDGAKIAFRSMRSGTYQIFVMNADGSNPVNVSNGHLTDFAAAWSPDSSRLLFTSFRDSNYEIYVVNADGSGLTNVTGITSGNQDGAWSPDGSKIAFRSDRNGTGDIFVMNSDGSNVVQLTNNTLTNDGPVWSSDGTRIAFWSYDQNGLGEIQVMNADGTNQIQLTGTTPNTGGNYSPIWSPDSHKLLFRSRRDGNAEVYVIDADAGNETNLTNNTADEFDYDWQKVPPQPHVPAPALTVESATTAPLDGDGDVAIEPGESAALSVQLHNKGDKESDELVATLTTSTPGVTIQSGTSAYRPIATLSSGGNEIPFVFSLADSVACGQRIDFEMRLTDPDNTTTAILNFVVRTGQASVTRTDISYNGPSVAIPDGNSSGVDIPLTVSGLNGKLSDLNFLIGGSSCNADEGSSTAGIDHTYVSDFTVTLTSPSGTTVTLVSGAGQGGNNFCNTLLDDEGGGTSIENATDADNPYSGTFLPAQPLTAFRGEDPNGTWIVHVTDKASGETGHVNAFTLSLAGYDCNRGIATPDLGLTISANHDPAEVGSDLTYAITVQSPTYGAQNIQVIDVLPAEVTFVSASSTQGSCAVAGLTVTCNLGNLPDSGAANIKITVRPNVVGPLSNTATVTSNSPDSNTANNSAGVNTTVARSADLTLTNTGPSSTVIPGQAVNYTITVKNNGPSPATGVIITDHLDSGQLQTFNVGNLAVNGSATVTVSTTASTAATMSNTATVHANENDPHPGNNTASQVTRIVQLFQFTIRQPVIPSCPVSSENFGRGTVYLNSAAPTGGLVVTLTNSNPKVEIPANVTIPAGGSFADFAIRANSVVDSAQSGTISASFMGTTLSQSITVRPIYAYLGSNHLVLGGHVAYFVQLDCGDSQQAVSVTLGSSNPGIASIDNPSDGVLTIPAGQKTGSFSVRVSQVSSEVTVDITATANGHTETDHLVLRP
jgi:uncharacterized repeat protein (TIGR01451 family)